MSRKITKESVAAFLENRPFTKANMSVIVNDGATYLCLHDNMIARRIAKTGNNLEISDAGWPTRTTRERLNGLPGVCVFQKNHTQYLAPFENGLPVFDKAVEWNGNWTSV